MPMQLTVALALLAAATMTPVPSGLDHPAPGTAAAPELAWQVVSRRPHDPEAFTQGLELTADGRLFESTGIRRRSTVREVDPRSGEVLRRRPLPDERFGEGITIVADRLIGLTFQAGVATAYELDTLEPIESFTYEGEGWGLCYDGTRLVMSDGGPDLSFRDPRTFELTGSVRVTVGDQPLTLLNELECVDGAVWANVWKDDRIFRIDPDSGVVTGYLDLEGVVEPWPSELDPRAVLNGIAWDEDAGTFLVTGKFWPELVEIRVSEPAAQAVVQGAAGLLRSMYPQRATRRPA